MRLRLGGLGFLASVEMDRYLAPAEREGQPDTFTGGPRKNAARSRAVTGHCLGDFQFSLR